MPPEMFAPLEQPAAYWTHAFVPGSLSASRLHRPGPNAVLPKRRSLIISLLKAMTFKAFRAFMIQRHDVSLDDNSKMMSH